MPEPRSIGPVKPSASARSGETTPMPTVRCFQMRLSVSSVSYSSTYCGNRSVKSSMKSSRDPCRFWLSPRTADSLWIRVAVYCGIRSGRSRKTPPGR
ncbi:hypothetical protein D3C83_12210 [compost metagenome]